MDGMDKKILKKTYIKTGYLITRHSPEKQTKIL